MKPPAIAAPLPATSQGAALLVMLLIVFLAFSSLLLSSTSQTALHTEKQKKTQEALSKAKESLIAWSVLQGDLEENPENDKYPRPGTLPCPDNNFIGKANSGNETGSCSAAGNTSLGRFPWRTLGTGPLQDADGNILWYAVSDNFRRPGLANAAINSDTKGTLALYAADGTTLLTPAGEELAAIIFAPGPPLGGQDRANQPDAAASHLETAFGKNNRSASGPFIAGPVTDAQGNLIANDLVIGITARELIAAIEKRALNEAQTALAKFASANGGKYPNPAAATGANCTSTVSNVKSSIPLCASDSTTCFGRLPEDSLKPFSAPWFSENAWGRVIAYAVNKKAVLDDSGTHCSAAIKLDGTARDYVLLAPGSARNGQIRPSTNLPDYIEDEANQDAWGFDPKFATPSVHYNDQLRSK